MSICPPCVGETPPLGDVEFAVVADVNVGAAEALGDERQLLADLVEVAAVVAIPEARAVTVAGEPEIVADLLCSPALAPVDVLVGEVPGLVEAVQRLALVVGRRPERALDVGDDDAVKQSLSVHGESSLCWDDAPRGSGRARRSPRGCRRP